MEETIKVRYESVLPMIVLPCDDFPGGRRFDGGCKGVVIEVGKTLGESLLRSGHFKPVAAVAPRGKEKGGDE